MCQSDSYKRAAKKAARPMRPPDARCMLLAAALPVDVPEEAEPLAEPLAEEPPLVPVGRRPPVVWPLRPVVLAALEELPPVVLMPAPPPMTVVEVLEPTTVNEVIPAVPL